MRASEGLSRARVSKDINNQHYSSSRLQISLVFLETVSQTMLVTKRKL